MGCGASASVHDAKPHRVQPEACALDTPTVVLVQAPGAVVMPWRDSVEAILVLFLGGEETGNAWASLIFGDRAPTGRLPIMMPVSEDDTIKPTTSLSVDYSEGLKTSYRNPSFKAAYPFGHGLAYTSFEYLAVVGGNCSSNATDAVQCVELRVHNNGSRAGRTVVQAYLELPRWTGYETPILRSFQKTASIMPGESQQVLLAFSAKDLSYYDAATGGWPMPEKVTVHVGESSQDIRAKVLLTVPGGVKHSTSWMQEHGYVFALTACLVLAALATAAAVGIICQRRVSKRKARFQTEMALCETGQSSSGEE